MKRHRRCSMLERIQNASSQQQCQFEYGADGGGSGRIILRSLYIKRGEETIRFA